MQEQLIKLQYSEDNSIYNIDFVFFYIFKTDDNLLIKCADTMDKWNPIIKFSYSTDQVKS